MNETPQSNPALKSLLIIGVIASSLSGVALLLHWSGLVHLGAAAMVCLPLTVLVLAVCLAMARPDHRGIVLQRIYAGLFAGFVGLIAYDVIRWVLVETGLIPANPFRVIEVFGLLIMQTDTDTLLTKSVGWGFHIWNGLTFAMMFTLAFGRGRILWAVIWSLILEVAMLASYPSMFHIVMGWPFVSISLIGHVAFGLAVGWAARGAVKE